MFSGHRPALRGLGLQVKGKIIAISGAARKSFVNCYLETTAASRSRQSPARLPKRIAIRGDVQRSAQVALVGCDDGSGGRQRGACDAVEEHGGTRNLHGHGAREERFVDGMAASAARTQSIDDLRHGGGDE